MGHDAKVWRNLRREFVEAAAKYGEYETFIERNETSEDWYCNNGRYFTIGRIRWPYGSYRKCWILAPFSGENEEPFSVMKTLFAKAWLWLPRQVADEVVETAEKHLSVPPSPPVGTELFWANSDYQYWCWLLWFHWVRHQRVANPSEAKKPSQKMILAPFYRSADLIAQWGLDSGDGSFPEWLAPKPTLDDDLEPPVTERVGVKGLTWQAVQAELELLRLKGEPYTSEAKLAEKIGCKKFLVNKALKNGPAELQEWATKPRGASRLNASPEASELALELTPQSRENDPAEFVEPEAVDAALEYLLEQATGQERQRIKEMEPSELQELARILFRDPDKEEQVRRHRRAKQSRRD